jgi:hypothetical protein
MEDNMNVQPIHPSLQPKNPKKPSQEDRDSPRNKNSAHCRYLGSFLPTIKN